jgi:hypothetical protein
MENVMMIIYKQNDLIPVEFSEGEDSFVLYFSPVTVAQKTCLQARQAARGDSPEAYLEFVRDCIGVSLKKAKGLSLSDGEDWQPKFEDGMLSSESLDDLLSLPVANSVVTFSGLFLRATPREGRVIGLDGQPLPGVVVKKSVKS